MIKYVYGSSHKNRSNYLITKPKITPVFFSFMDMDLKYKPIPSIANVGHFEPNPAATQYPNTQQE